jgi:hypothetical protein
MAAEAHSKKTATRAMNLLVGLSLVGLLVIALLGARHIIRRDRLRRARYRKNSPWLRKMSARSEMRAYNDPTTMMGSITNSRPSARGKTSRKEKRAKRR